MSLDDELRAEVPGDPDLAELERLAADLHARGIDFRVEHGRLIQSVQDRDRDRETILPPKEHLRIGIVSDTHGGSKFEQLTALRAFYRYADEREVDLFIHGGDLTQGPDRMHPGMEHEVHAHGSDAQVEYVAQTFPRSERYVKTYVIGGNHDASHLKQGGANVVRQVCGKRDDLVHLGQDAAYLTIGNLRAYVVHPDGGGSYAKSYKGQKLSEALPVERRVNLLLLGHFHNWIAFQQRDALVYQLPCFQSQYGWMARKGLHPDIGGIVLDVWLDDNGGIRRAASEYVAYRPLDNDYDHDVSAAVSRAWSSQGLAVET